VTHSRRKFRPQRRTIYLLKKQYGVRVTLCRTFDDQTNIQTGLMTGTQEQVRLKGVLLPALDTRQAQYRQDYITSARPFTYGALFDTKNAHLLVSVRDVPADFPVDLNCWFLIEGKRWEAKKLTEYAGQECLGVDIERRDGQPPESQLDAGGSSTMSMGQETSP
jgi:hypothetical protein